MTKKQAIHQLEIWRECMRVDTADPDVIETYNMAIQALQEPTGDLISRQAVQDYIAKYLSQYLYNDVREAVETIDEYIGELPSAEKTGRWIRKTKVDAYDIAGVKTWGIKYQCNKCGFIHTVIEDFGHYGFCPKCGSHMIEEGR